MIFRRIKAKPDSLTGLAFDLEMCTEMTEAF